MNDELVFGLGKLPSHILGALLERYAGASDPSVVVSAGIGMDAAVIDMGEEYLVVKSDPITFATDQVGWYAVHVNANDIACMGARPRWFLGTLLLPPNTPASLVETLFKQVHEACEGLGVTMVGGHTEVSYGLDRPLIAGTMLGTVPHDRLVSLKAARPGDHVIMARHFPIEATAIIARERTAELQELGWNEEEIREAQNFLWDPGISVVQAARVATAAAPLHGMHDPTEGGVATALREIATASGLGMEVDADALTMLPISARLCKEFDINPLGAIASGALLIVVAPEHSKALLDAFEQAAIPAAVVGALTAAGEETWLCAGEDRMPLPVFPVDEITKLY